MFESVNYSGDVKAAGTMHIDDVSVGASGTKVTETGKRRSNESDPVQYEDETGPVSYDVAKASVEKVLAEYSPDVEVDSIAVIGLD